MHQKLTRWLDLLTLAVLVVAVLVGGRALYQRSILPALQDRPVAVDNWRELSSIGHRQGPENAAVTIVEFIDYQCPACASMHGVLQRLLTAFEGDVAVVYRHWPLSIHTAARPAAIAAECASLQDSFAEYHDRLFAGASWYGGGPEAFLALAEAVNIPDLERFSECFSSGATAPAVERDISAATAIGARGTPAFVIEGMYYPSFPDSATLFSIIEGLRAR